LASSARAGRILIGSVHSVIGHPVTPRGFYPDPPGGATEYAGRFADRRAASPCHRSAAVPATVAEASLLITRGQDARSTAGKMLAPQTGLEYSSGQPDFKS